MRKLIIVVFFGVCCSSFAGWRQIAPATSSAQQQAENLRRRVQAQKAAAEEKARSDEYQAKFKADLAREFVRVVDGQTNTLLAAGWCKFSGSVAQNHPDGARIVGSYQDMRTLETYTGDFLVKNFPGQPADGDTVGNDPFLFAKITSNTSYTTVAGSSRTIRCLDYGTPCAPPPVEGIVIEKPTAKDLASVRQAALDEKMLKHHQTLAENGDPYGWLQMGKRYLAGNGVEKDEEEGMRLIKLAATAGNPEAAALLKKLEAEPAP